MHSFCQFLLYLNSLNLYLYSVASVEYASVDEAKAVINDPEDIVLDGCTLSVEYGKVI